MVSKEEKLRLLRRLRDDFEFYAENVVTIKSKSGVQKFKLNKPQKKLLELIDKQYAENKKIRIIILKARQQGFSTFVSAYLYHKLSLSFAKKGIVIGNKADNTRALFDMYRRIHNSMPPELKPTTDAISRKELNFPKLDTSLIVATAGGDDVGRGETLTHAHFSEFAFWPKATAQANWVALTQCVPNVDDTAIFVESTANGMSGIFYDTWMGAVAGTNGFTPFFSPWFDSEEYRRPVPTWGMDGYTEDELKLKELYGLDDEQLCFRRERIALNGYDAFEVEYPSTPEEAFKSSGLPVFNLTTLHEMLKKSYQPIKRMQVDGSSVTENPHGALKVFVEKELGQRYTIGADVANGTKGDYSVAQVLDAKGQQVAVWRSNQVDPDFFASILNTLGRYYNQARIIIERNNHGLLPATRLAKDFAYPNMFTDVREDEVWDRDTPKLGFFTSAQSKPLIIDKVREALRKREINIVDEVTLKEMQNYTMTPDEKMEAEVGCHDDCVMALAFAVHALDRDFEPVTFDDSYYVRAV